MAVSGNFRVETRPFSGYRDPALPIGSYIAQAGIAGDASGGGLFINFLFQLSADRRVTELYNLEQISIDTDANLAQRGLISTLNMDSLSPTRPASPQKWSFVTSQDSVSDSALLISDLLNHPIWLGSPALPSGSSAAGLRLAFLNVDLRLYAATIQGYIWGPRSVLAPGGPQRPVNGFFG